MRGQSKDKSIDVQSNGEIESISLFAYSIDRHVIPSHCTNVENVAYRRCNFRNSFTLLKTRRRSMTIATIFLFLAETFSSFPFSSFFFTNQLAHNRSSCIVMDIHLGITSRMQQLVKFIWNSLHVHPIFVCALWKRYFHFWMETTQLFCVFSFFFLYYHISIDNYNGLCATIARQNQLKIV